MEVLSRRDVREPGDIAARFECMSRDLTKVLGTDRSSAADEDRLRWIEEARALQRRVDALSAILVNEADEAASAMRARHSHLPDWLARNGQETRRQATGLVWASRDLERRPQIRDAAASGQISLSQAKAINVALDGLPERLDRGQLRTAENLLLSAADHTDAETLRGMSERVLAQVAPAKAETLEARAERLAERDARAAARRSLRFGPECDGSTDFSGSLPVIDARQLKHLVQTIADRRFRAAKDVHDRHVLSTTPQQRLADALVTVVTASESRSTANEGRAGGLPAGATRVNVMMSADDLLDRAQARGFLADGTPVGPGELRRLLCTADLVPVVLGTDSTILDVGFAHRLAPPALRHAVGLRDGSCAFPGCSAPLEHCDLHHVVPRQSGGPTRLSNLVALCRSHHGLVEPVPSRRRGDGRLEHVDQWEVRIDGRGLPEFIPPAATDPSRTPIRRRVSHVQDLLDTG